MGEQYKFINDLIENNKRRVNEADAIQKAYEECLSDTSEKSFEALMPLLEEHNKPCIISRLTAAYCCSDENINTVLQDGSLAVWQNIKKDIANGVSRGNFINFSYGIYRNKTNELIRNTVQADKNLPRTSLDADICEGFSLNSVLFGETDTNPEVDLEREERRRLFAALQIIYCFSFMNSDAFPPRALALYYARVLPHELNEIKDTKTVSAVWAYKTMGERIIRRLKDESEKNIRRDFSKKLRWGESFNRQLREKPDIYSKPLSEQVYTKLYGKKQIEDWADSMHRTTYKAAADKIAQQPQLISAIKEYINEKSKLFVLCKGGKNEPYNR